MINLDPILSIYIHALDWIERDAVQNSINFAEGKQFQNEVTAGQLVNQGKIRRMISEEEILLLLNI